MEMCLWCDFPKDAHVVIGDGKSKNCIVLTTGGAYKIIKGIENE